MIIANKEFRKSVNFKREYDLFNHKFFDGELPDIKLRWSLSRKHTGVTRASRNRVTGKVKVLSITLSTFYEMDRENFELTLLHEMIHVWCFANNLDSNVSGGHGSNFIKKANEISSRIGKKITIKDEEPKTVSKDVDSNFIVVLSSKFFFTVKEKKWNQNETAFISRFGSKEILKRFGPLEIYKSNDPRMFKTKQTTLKTLNPYYRKDFDESKAKLIMTITEPLEIDIDDSENILPFVSVFSKFLSAIFKESVMQKWIVKSPKTAVVNVSLQNGSNGIFQIVSENGDISAKLLDKDKLVLIKSLSKTVDQRNINDFIKECIGVTSPRIFSDLFSKSKTADARTVIKRIFHTVKDKNKAMEMAQRVDEFSKTKNPAKDLTPAEQRMLYGPVDFGGELQLTKKRKLDVGWNDHAEYRSELRDVDHERVNEKIRDRMIEQLNPPRHNDLRFKEPGLGTFVVDFDTSKNPVDAEVITVWGSRTRRNLI